MANRYNVYYELMCGALLATIVAVSPKYLRELHLGFDGCTPDCMMSYNCPGIWIYMFSGLVICLSLIFSRCRRWHVVIQLIWLVISHYYYQQEIHNENCMWEILKNSGDHFGLFAGIFTSITLFFSAAYQCLKWLYLL